MVLIEREAVSIYGGFSFSVLQKRLPIITFFCYSNCTNANWAMALFPLWWFDNGYWKARQRTNAFVKRLKNNPIEIRLRNFEVSNTSWRNKSIGALESHIKRVFSMWIELETTNRIFSHESFSYVSVCLSIMITQTLIAEPTSKIIISHLIFEALDTAAASELEIKNDEHIPCRHSCHDHVWGSLPH